MDPSNDFRKQLEGYRLTTAEIIYFRPDHPSILQQFIWQAYDISPDFPIIHGFVRFWRREIHGALHSVRVANKRLIGPAEVRKLASEYGIN